jgi:hypothetical protein
MLVARVTGRGGKRTWSFRLLGLQQEAEAWQRQPWFFSDLDLIHLLFFDPDLAYLRESGC